MAHDDFTSKPVFVYLIEEADSQRFVKIGIAHNPKRRIADLQVGNARLLHIRYLLACESMDHAIVVERAIASFLAGYVVIGEWFSVSADMVIGMLKNVMALAEILPDISVKKHRSKRGLRADEQPINTPSGRPEPTPAEWKVIQFLRNEPQGGIVPLGELVEAADHDDEAIPEPPLPPHPPGGYLWK